jgi:shikimate kinase
MPLIFITGGSRQGKSTIAQKLKELGYKIINTDYLYEAGKGRLNGLTDIGKEHPLKTEYYTRNGNVVIEGCALAYDEERDVIEKIRGEKGKLFLLNNKEGWERWKKHWEKRPYPKGVKVKETPEERMYNHKKKFDRLEDKAILIKTFEDIKKHL